MTKSALQIARAAYQPKVPAALKGAVKAVDGEYTQSVADQEEIKKLFPNTYGMPIVTFEKSNEEKAMPVMNVGVILRWSGSRWSQRDRWFLRRYQGSQRRFSSVWFHLGPGRFDRS